MHASLALGCAVYFDHDLSADPAPFAALSMALTDGAEHARLRQWVMSARTQQVDRAAPFDAGELLRKVASGTVAAAAFETPERPDEQHLLVLAQTTPAGRLRDGVPPHHWRYSLIAAFGPAVLATLGVARVRDTLVDFADAVGVKAGVMHWTETTAFASALAMGAGTAGLTPAQTAWITDSWYWRAHWGRIVRGPAWGTFLGAAHVARLGGIAEVQSGCGATRVARLRSGGAFLQLTAVDAPLAEGASDRRLDALTAFLGPVLDITR